MLRVHFTSDDLTNTRVASAPDPLWELALSIHVLRLRKHDPIMADWKQEVAGRLEPADPLRAEVELLLAMNPPVGYFPDFLTPAEGADGFMAGLDSVLSTPKPRLRREIDALGRARGSLPAAVNDVGDGRAELLHELGQAISRFHEVAIAPVWDRVRAAFDADRALRARTLLDGGVGALLSGLHPSVRFADDVLEISDYPNHRDLHLGGRGLLLVPSYFKSAAKPVALVDPDLPPVLVYPVDRAAAAMSPSGRAALTALLGRTRASVLELLSRGGTTTEIARQLGISAAAASQQVGVLRDAGLAISVRDRNSVLHALTPLGHAMLGDL